MLKSSLRQGDLIGSDCDVPSLLHRKRLESFLLDDILHAVDDFIQLLGLLVGLIGICRYRRAVQYSDEAVLFLE